MGYLELDGEDQAQAQVDLESVLRRQNAVKMIIYDPNQEQVVRDAKKIADEEPDLRWVVWVRNVDLLLMGKKANFAKKIRCSAPCQGKAHRLNGWMPTLQLLNFNFVMLLRRRNQ